MMKFARNGKPNKAAAHDLGLAAGNICVEATARGLMVHQMIGILPERVRELYGVPEDAEPLTALAIGHLGGGGDLPAALQPVLVDAIAAHCKMADGSVRAPIPAARAEAAGHEHALGNRSP